METSPSPHGPPVPVHLHNSPTYLKLPVCSCFFSLLCCASTKSRCSLLSADHSQICDQILLCLFRLHITKVVIKSSTSSVHSVFHCHYHNNDLPPSLRLHLVSFEACGGPVIGHVLGPRHDIRARSLVHHPIQAGSSWSLATPSVADGEL